MSKKILSIILAISMVLTMCVSAFFRVGSRRRRDD